MNLPLRQLPWEIQPRNPILPCSQATLHLTLLWNDGVDFGGLLGDLTGPWSICIVSLTSD